MITKRNLLINLLILSVLVFAHMAFAQNEAKAPARMGATKVIEGEVSAITKDGVAVVYHRDTAKGTEDEVFIPLDNSVQLVHKRSISEIKTGDIVSIQYYEQIKEGKKNEPGNKFKGTVLTFLKPAAKKPEAQTTDSSEEESESGAALPLKGIK
ncbi:hypothetical protein EPO66_00335 [bacterium]|nr:MAG: hypothetical protein EPO66_00335 [bacterium]